MVDLCDAACLELPLKVLSIKKAIEAVGGEKEIARSISDASFINEPDGLELRLRKDQFHHPLKSIPVRTNNFVVQISVPTKYRLINSLKKSIELAKSDKVDVIISPKYHVSLTHRFREIADFQYYTGDIPFAIDMKNSLFVGDLASIQKMSLKSENMQLQQNDLLPPAKFSVNSQPFYYGYQQSPYVKIINDESGERRLLHTAASAKVISNLLTWGDDIPLQPPHELDEHPKASVQECIDVLKQLFENRPSYTRRTLQHILGHILSRQLKFALPYVSYYYRSGPWRGAYIKYGVDPAKDNKMSLYQVEHFRISTDDSIRKTESDEALNNNSYTFDGTIYPDAPMLQLVDIQDGFLEKYIGATVLRKHVDENDGWYPERTMMIIRKILRAELVSLHKYSTAMENSDKVSLVESLEL